MRSRQRSKRDERRSHGRGMGPRPSGAIARACRVRLPAGARRDNTAHVPLRPSATSPTPSCCLVGTLVGAAVLRPASRAPQPRCHGHSSGGRSQRLHGGLFQVVLIDGGTAQADDVDVGCYRRQGRPCCRDWYASKGKERARNRVARSTERAVRATVRNG